VHYLIRKIFHPPAKTFELPAATDVHPDSASPIRPHPRLFTNTLLLPEAIGAECAGQGLPGNKCTVLTSLCLLIGRLLANTFPEPAALTMPEQWATSASPILVTAGIVNSLCNYS